MRRSPDDHRLLSRLALTYYEQRKYARALDREYEQATRALMRLIRRGVSRMARGPCGEGARWARGLVAHCWSRVGTIGAKQ
ncbi:MAG TPA: hypothetical protein VGL86_02915, partial [Polyangia bacterium]